MRYVVSLTHRLLEHSFVVPDAALADVPATLRAPILAVSPSAEVGDNLSEVCAGLWMMSDSHLISRTNDHDSQTDSNRSGEPIAETRT